MKFQLALAALVFGAGAVAVRGDDWPEFRGPTGQGRAAAKDLPVEWGKDKNVAWTTPIPGLGWSSPVVVAGRVYLTTAVPVKGSGKGDQSLRALCLDAGSGKILWDKEVFHQDGRTAPPIQSKNSHASPTPLVHDGKLYVHFGHQGTACLDVTGKVLWRNTELKYKPVHGNGGTPVVTGDKLIFSCDGGDEAYVVALDRNTGKVKWKTPRDVTVPKMFSFSTPLVVAVDGKEQVISPGSGAVMAYDPATGREIWRVSYRGYSVIPRPVYGHGLIFISTGYEAPSLLALRPDGAGDVTETHVAWRTRQNAPHTPSPSLVGDELYLVSDNGIASCLEAKTGKVHWSERLGGDFSASPIEANGRVYFQREDGVGIVVKAGMRYEELARNALGEKTYASYAAADGALFIRTEKRLYKFQSRGGQGR
jgi:outer membrane protein assembly factor BamB